MTSPCSSRISVRLLPRLIVHGALGVCITQFSTVPTQTSLIHVFLLSVLTHSSPSAGTSHAHADVTGIQLKTLQTVLRRLQTGEIARVEGDLRFQVGVGGNKIVTARQWKERLSKSFLWIDFCCIPQMSIPLTAELLGFNENQGSILEGGAPGGNSLLLVKAAVLQELGADAGPLRPAVAPNSSEGEVSTLHPLPGGVRRSHRLIHSVCSCFHRSRNRSQQIAPGGRTQSRTATQRYTDTGRSFVKSIRTLSRTMSKGGEGETSAAADGDKETTADHRHLSSRTEGLQKAM